GNCAGRKGVGSRRSGAASRKRPKAGRPARRQEASGGRDSGRSVRSEAGKSAANGPNGERSAGNRWSSKRKDAGSRRSGAVLRKRPKAGRPAKRQQASGGRGSGRSVRSDAGNSAANGPNSARSSASKWCNTRTGVGSGASGTELGER